MKPTLFLSFVAAVASGVGTRASTPPVPEIPKAAPSAAAWEKLPTHPRLFANADRFRALRAQNDPVTQKLKSLLLAQADGNLNAPPISYIATGSFLLGQMGNVQGRILSLALAYRLTDDARYFAKAREELLTLAAVPNWGTNHMLDVGVAAVGAAVGLDWLFDRLTADERSVIATAIAEKALRPSLQAEEGKNGWVDGNFNWNQVCNGGLSVGALAIAELEPALARRIVNRAIKNVPAAARTYEPEGTYAEGTGYWSFGTTYQVILIDALRSVFGTSGGLDRPGFVKSPDFIAQMIAPSGEDYNFSDAHRRNPGEPVMLWFARERRQRSVARELFASLEKDKSAVPEATRGQDAGLGRHTGFALLWWDPALPADQGAPGLPLHWIADGELPLAVFRTAWNDPRAVYVAVKGGTPNNSHGQMDVGSFILEADGVRWALDLGSENYSKMREAKLTLWDYSQDSTRWTTFRVGPEAHNLIRFEGARQQIDGHAKIHSAAAPHGGAAAVVDLSPLYRSQVSAVSRQVALQADRTVIIQDEWQTGPRATEVSWQWLTRAEISRTAKGVMLRQDGEKLELMVDATAPIEIEIQDRSKPQTLPQDSANPGLKRVVFRLKTAAEASGRIAVKAVPGGT